jgi:DNA gyrase subunit A
MGRNARGVKGMNLEEGQSVIAMLVSKQHQTVVAARKAKDEADELQQRHKELQASESPDSAALEQLSIQLDEARTKATNAEIAATEAVDALPKESLPSVLTATQNGYGKRTSITEHTRHGRGTKGMIAIQQSERNGKVVAATLVRAEDEIMLITDKGVLVRTRVSEIREMGRATQGVTLIGLDEGSQLSGLQRIVENDATLDSSDTPDTEADAPGNADAPASNSESNS